MPGVPSGRGCDACRKQKKKCDQAVPSCSRCTRLKLPCAGAGQQRYKFVDQHGPQITHGTVAAQSKTKQSKQVITVTTTSVPKSPTNQLTSLLNAYVSAVGPSTDLRFNLSWTYGGYLDEVPLRLGNNKALDAAASALLDAHSNYCRGVKVTFEGLARYSHALKTLRYCLDDPIIASAPETLCAVNLLLVCQGFLGISEGAWSGHVEGMARMLVTRSNAATPSLFEQKLLASMRGSIIFEALANCRIQMPAKEWKRLVDNPLDGDSWEGKLMRSLCMVPYFIESRSKKCLSPEEDAKHLAEILAGYHLLRPVIADLRKLFTEIQNQKNSGGSDRRAAYVTRTYGLCLSIALIINCVLGAVYTDDEEYPAEAEEFSQEILTISDFAVKYRPLGASFVPLCLSMAWIGSHDALLKYALEEALEEYQRHPAWGQMVKITIPDLVWTKKRFTLMNPDSPYKDKVSYTT